MKKFANEYPGSIYPAAEKLDRVWEEHNLDDYLYTKIASFLSGSATNFKKIKISKIESKYFRGHILNLYYKERKNDLTFYYGAKLPKSAITHIENILHSLYRKNHPLSATYKD